MRGKTWGTETELIARLKAGDEAAFAALVNSLDAPLLSFARTFTTSQSLSQDIVQETWLATIKGLRGFECRSSIRTWIFSILVRRARTLVGREARVAGKARGTTAAEWEPGRGRIGLWEETPLPWHLEDPAALYQSSEALEVVRAAVEALPETQRQVVLLRDVEGLPALDVCNILELSETNQRVLLHRGRASVRRELDRYIRDGEKSGLSTGATGKDGGGER